MSKLIFHYDILKLYKIAYKERDPQNPGESQPEKPGRETPHPTNPPDEVPTPQTPPDQEPPPFFVDQI